MEERQDYEEQLDSHRHGTPLKSIVELMVKNSSGNTKTGNEPIYAALGKDLDETIPTISDRTLTRNRALLHYIATLAVSNSEKDEFNYEFVQSLLDGGANINEAVDTYGQTIFHEVARSWNLDVAAFLLDNGANIDQQDKYGRSPLHVCAAANHADMTEFLLQQGADINSRSTGDGQTPLHFAAKNDATLSLKALLGFGANIDSLDNRGRPPLQVAAELSRSETVRILIEEGATSCIYDANGSSAITVLIEKLPFLAVEALDQLHVSDTITRRELFYLNLLEESRLKKETRKARTPLETAVIGRQFDVLMHPVMQRLVAIKWSQYGKFGTILDLVINLVYAILFTVFAVETPAVGEDLYLPLSDKAWRLFLGLVLILINAYMMYLQVKTTIKSRKKQKSWIKWRIQQLKDDLQYCHPRWQEEKYVKDEMRLIKGVPLLSTIDAWFIFDWLIILVIFVTIGLNLAFFFDESHSVKSGYIRVLSILVILVWLRILKYLRPFPGIGTLVLILGATGGDFVNWGFFYLLLFIPFTSCFWIIFGGKAEIQVPSYASAQRLVYTTIQMSVGEDFDLEGLVAADPVMARLLSAVFIAVMVIVCLNILIAYLSNTFTTVYSKAVENTSMQRAINILNIEKFLTKNRWNVYFQYVREHASPEKVSSITTEMSADKRQVGKNAEQLQKDFKKSHEILTQRFSRKVGKGQISAFDVLLRDVEKLKNLQIKTVSDLKNIQTNLETLGRVMFGSSSPLNNFFQVKCVSTKVRQRKISQRVRVEDLDQLSPTLPRSRPALSTERLDSQTTRETRESQRSEDDEQTKQKTSLGDLIPRVSILRRKEKNEKKRRKGVIQFVEETNDDDDDDGGDLRQESDREEEIQENENAFPRNPRDQSPMRSVPSFSHVQHPHIPRHKKRSNSSTSHESRRAPHTLEVVPYNGGWNNDGFERDNQEDVADDFDKWERLSADSISL